MGGELSVPTFEFSTDTENLNARRKKKKEEEEKLIAPNVRAAYDATIESLINMGLMNRAHQA
jgi:hypothetical protein